jgi:Tol biopolymer transport system component
MTTYPPVNWISPDGGDRPSFSRDGSEVVYQIRRDLLITGAKGGGKPRMLLSGSDTLIPSRADWSWSPTTIAFGGKRGKSSTIWLIECDGTNLRELPNHGDLRHSTYPSWYEDLQSIVVIDSGDPKFRALWRLTVDGSAAPVQLTSMEDFCAGRPTAAPGGSDAPVAFAGTRGPYNENFNQIWTVQPPSLEAAQLDPQQGRSPNWSPDGKWILYESNRLTGVDGNYQLFVAPAPGPGAPAMEPVPLSDPEIFAQHGEWSRQQDRIVFERGNGKALGVIEVPEEFRR